MSKVKTHVSYKLIKDDLMPFGMSYRETCKVVDSEDWHCPLCGRSKCWNAVTPPKDDSDLLQSEQCPVAVFVTDLASTWGTEPDATAKILVSMLLVRDLGVATLNPLDVAGRLASAVSKAHQKGKERPDAEQSTQSTANLWTVEYPRKPAALKQTKPKAKQK